MNSSKGFFIALSLVLTAFGASPALAADRLKIVTENCDQGLTDRQNARYYREALDRISSKCEAWGGRTLEGTDRYVAAFSNHYVIAAICNY